MRSAAFAWHRPTGTQTRRPTPGPSSSGSRRPSSASPRSSRSRRSRSPSGRPWWPASSIPMSACWPSGTTLRPRRGRHRQRHGLPGDRARRRALGAGRLLQPARDARCRPAAGALGAAGRRSPRVGRVSRRVPPGPRRTARRAQRLSPLGRRAGLPARRVQHLLTVAEPLRVPGGHRLPAGRGTRRDVASPRLVGARRRAGLRRSRASARRRQGHLRLAGLAGLHGRRPHAAPDRRPGGHAAPRRSIDGPAPRAHAAGSPHVRRGVPAPGRPYCPSATCSSRTAATTRSARAFTSACP